MKAKAQEEDGFGEEEEGSESEGLPSDESREESLSGSAGGDEVELADFA